MARIQVRNDCCQPDVRMKPTTRPMKKKHLELPKILQGQVIIVRTFVHHARLLNQVFVNRFIA